MSSLKILNSPRKRLNFSSNRLKPIKAPAIQPSDLAPSQEDIAYSKLLEELPSFQQLAAQLDLVSAKTGKKLIAIDLEPYYQNAKRLLPPEEAYTRKQLINKISLVINVNTIRPEQYLDSLLEAGAIQKVPRGELYYLAGSTPF